MKATSIHLTSCDIGSSEVHNKREKELDYVRKDLSELNESFSYIDHSLQTELASIKREVKAKTGRKLQKNAIPIKEGVIVIDENTTLKDLQNFCDDCRNKFGMIPLQIHIHRDEGHVNAKEWKPNLHAHITWRMYDEEGRNVRLSKQDVTDMQTMAAHHLHMARGQSSDKKHLTSLQQKIKAEELRLEGIRNAVKAESKKLPKEAAKAVYEATVAVLGGKVKKELDQTKEALEKAENTISEQSESIEYLERGLTAAKDTNQMLLEKVGKMKAKFERQDEDIAKIEAIREENRRIKAAYAEKEKALEAKEYELNAKMREVGQVLGNVKRNIDDVLKVTSGTSLTTSQAIDIASGKDVEVEDFYHPEHGKVKMSDIEINRNIVMRWNSDKKTLMLKADGRMQKSMHDPVWRTLEDWFKRFKTMLNDIRERSQNWGKSMKI